MVHQIIWYTTSYNFYQIYNEQSPQCIYCHSIDIKPSWIALIKHEVKHFNTNQDQIAYFLTDKYLKNFYVIRENINDHFEDVCASITEFFEKGIVTKKFKNKIYWQFNMNTNQLGFATLRKYINVTNLHCSNIVEDHSLPSQSLQQFINTKVSKFAQEIKNQYISHGENAVCIYK